MSPCSSQNPEPLIAHQWRWDRSPCLGFPEKNNVAKGTYGVSMHAAAIAICARVPVFRPRGFRARPCMGFQSYLKIVAFLRGRRRKVRRRISKGVLRKLDPLVAPAPSRWIHRFSCRKNKHEIQLFSPGDIAAVRSGIKGDPWPSKRKNFLPSGCNT